MSGLAHLTDAELEERESRLLRGLRKLHFELERRTRERQNTAPCGKIVTAKATPEADLAELLK